jgi:hypothetical protein
MRLDHVDIAAAKDEAEASGVQLYRVFERQSGGESQITVSRLGRERHTLAVLDISVIASCHAVDASADGYPIFVIIWSTGECSSAETVLHRCSLPSPLLLRRDPPPPPLPSVRVDYSYEDPHEASNDIRDRLSRIEQLLHDRLPTHSSYSLPGSGSASGISPQQDVGASGDVALRDGQCAHQGDRAQSRPQRDGFMIRGRYFGASAMSHVGGRGGAVDLMKALSVSN